MGERKNNSILIREGKLRAGWRILFFILTLFSIAFGVSIIVSRVKRICAPLSLIPPLPIPYPYRLLIERSLIFFLLLFVSAIFARFVDKRPARTIGFSFHKGFLKEYLLGLIISFILVGVIFLIEWAVGLIKVETSLITKELIFKVGFISLVFFIFQSAFEELLFRGYLFQNLIAGTNEIAAIVILSTIFGLAHLGNPNATLLSTVNTVLAGVWLSIAYIKTRSLWFPSGLHFSWNYFMGTIFGLPVSGVSEGSSLLRSIHQKGRILTGGSYGPEGGLICTIILTIVTWYILRTKKIAPHPQLSSFWESYLGRKTELKEGEAIS